MILMASPAINGRVRARRSLLAGPCLIVFQRATSRTVLRTAPRAAARFIAHMVHMPMPMLTMLDEAMVFIAVSLHRVTVHVPTRATGTAAAILFRQIRARYRGGHLLVHRLRTRVHL
uniref:Putative secreted protein n=1 Tax=Anopheles triannulatus TaxID=58253 RepID=A0A2M4B214_9DIPT